MEKTKKPNRMTNVNLLNEDYERLVSMMIKDRELNRSLFVRNLINQEWNRRQNKTEQGKERVK